MELAAIVKARALAFIDIDELNRDGKLRLADIAPLVVGRYDFRSYPTKLDEFDIHGKGAAFNSGRLGDIVIDELKVYSGLMYAETLSSTEDSKKVILDLLKWGEDEVGLTIGERTIRQWAYVSQITFFSDFPLLRAISGPLDSLATKTGEFISDLFGETLPYRPMNMVAGHDPGARRSGIASFTIQQRANVKFNENKFFSEAPLPTDVHLRFLRELEEDSAKLYLRNR